MIIRFWNTRSKPAGTHGSRLPAGMCRPTACRCRPATALRTAPRRPCSCPAKAKSFFLTLPEEWINLGNLMSARAAVIEAEQHDEARDGQNLLQHAHAVEPDLRN